MSPRPEESPVEQHLRETDGLPGERAGLPPGTLAGPPPDPQGDEHRDPPPIQESGRGNWARRMDLGHEGVSPSGNREPPPEAALSEYVTRQTRTAMSGTIEKARDIFIVGLRNQHAVENQAIELLQRQIGRLENYPEMVARMQEHVRESQEQARRIEEILSGLGTSHSSMKDTAQSIMGNLMALGHTVAPDEVLKNSMANLAFENFEIAGYLSLLTMADAAGINQAKVALNESLREEERMAQWVQEHIAPTVLRYIERTAAGQKAGV
jgi:ferritin-like metal-binding protein YciE